MEGGKIEIRVCFIGYRDIKDDTRFEIHPFTDKIDDLKGFIEKVRAKGGRDHPEDVQGGLKMCLM